MTPAGLETTGVASKVVAASRPTAVIRSATSSSDECRVIPSRSDTRGSHVDEEALNIPPPSESDG